MLDLEDFSHLSDAVLSDLRAYARKPSDFSTFNTFEAAAA